MRRIFLSVFVVFCTFRVLGQGFSFHVTPNDTITGDAPIGVETLFQVDVWNDGSSDLSLTWEVDTMALGTWAEYRICDNVTCYFQAQVKQDTLYNMAPIAPAAKGFLKFYVEPTGTGTGYSILRFLSPGGAVTIDVLFNLSGIVGIFEEKTNQSAVLYPNPARDFLGISFDGQLNRSGKISLLDISGKMIYEASFEATIYLKVPVAHLPEGLYFVRLEDKNGVFLTRKFMKI